MKELLSSGKNKIHIYFFALLSINYLFPLIIFGEITTFYHDNLDIMIPNNKIVGKYMLGDKESDAEAGENAGIKGIIVREKASEKYSTYPTLWDFVRADDVGAMHAHALVVRADAFVSPASLSRQRLCLTSVIQKRSRVPLSEDAAC